MQGGKEADETEEREPVEEIIPSPAGLGGVFPTDQEAPGCCEDSSGAEGPFKNLGCVNEGVRKM